MYGSTGQLAFIITNVFVKILTKTLIEINPQVLTRLDRCKIHNNICIIFKKKKWLIFIAWILLFYYINVLIIFLFYSFFW